GILWELDRRTGTILHAADLGIQDVFDVNPKTFAATVRPDKLPKLGVPTEYCPAPIGGKNWPSMAYSPDVHAFYVPYLHSCGQMTFMKVEQTPGGGGNGGGSMKFFPNPASDGNVGVFVALDLNGAVLWKYRQHAPFVSATLATAGGLVFVADLDR